MAIPCRDREKVSTLKGTHNGGSFSYGHLEIWCLRLTAGKVQCGVCFIDNNNNGWLSASLNLVKRVFPLEAGKGSGLGTGTKVNLLLAFCAHGCWPPFPFGPSWNISTSRTRPAPTTRAAAALQLAVPLHWHVLAYFAFRLVHAFFLLMLVLSVSASRRSFHPTFSAQPPYPCALFLLRINDSALDPGEDLESCMSPNP